MIFEMRSASTLKVAVRQNCLQQVCTMPPPAVKYFIVSHLLPNSFKAVTSLVTSDMVVTLFVDTMPDGN